MKLEPVIGLEIHVQLKTASKMFCRCANIFGDVPANSAICPICMGYPGTLPVPNQVAIDWTQKAGAALGCKLATQSKFDRKSYFYPDLPKGYQISQYDQPFCGEGKLALPVGEEELTVGIERIHLEEDAAKNIHPPSPRGSGGAGDSAEKYTLIDFNRAGTPLMEIVTKPDIRSAADARIFLQELQRIMRAIDVSDADMEKGQLRCDANISLREQGSSELHPKTEVKNLNSFRNVERALLYEIQRQTELWEKGTIPDQQATRGFNADGGETTTQRSKEEAADYRYFPEPDIPPFIFTEEFLQGIRSQVAELPHAKKLRLMKEHSLAEQQAQLLVDEPELSHVFEDVASELAQLAQENNDEAKKLPEVVKLAANIILRQVRGLAAAQRVAVRDLNITAENLAELIRLIHQSRVNVNAVSAVLKKMHETGGDPDPIIADLGLSQVSGEEELLKHVKEAISENPDVVAKIQAGKTSALQFLVGQVMAKTRGRALPDAVRALLENELKKS